mmetsp:Transcript_17574/g.26613  ORF Transcript_17574/g.26613 Transcript_17574/m.26613 type:complete len:83 (+) Transcript_17574:522-770(+)
MLLACWFITNDHFVHDKLSKFCLRRVLQTDCQHDWLILKDNGHASMYKYLLKLKDKKSDPSREKKVFVTLLQQHLVQSTTEY